MARPMPEVEPVTSATLPSRIMRVPLCGARRRRRIGTFATVAHVRAFGRRNRREIRCGSAAKESGNFEDRTGQSGGGSASAAAAAICSAACCRSGRSRFGIVGVLVLLLGYCALTRLAAGGGGGSARRPSQTSPAAIEARRRTPRTSWSACSARPKRRGAKSSRRRARIHADQAGRLLDANQSGCGAAQAAMGPFYCPTDKKIYIDPTSSTNCPALRRAGRFRPGLCHRP